MTIEVSVIMLWARRRFH